MSQFTGLGHMFAVNQIMGHLQNRIKSNATYFEISNDPHVNDTIHMIIQMVLIGIFTSLVTHIPIILEYCMRQLKSKMINSPIHFINWVVNSFKKKTKLYKIICQVPLITSAYLKNAELFTRLQWYLSMDDCKKVQPSEILPITPINEIYYVAMANDITSTDKEIILNEAPLVGVNMIVRFDNHDIYITSKKDTIEMNGDLDTQKRDNMIYELTVYTDTKESDIIHRFCNHAIIKYNTTKQKWEQKIYNHKNGQWDSGTKCYSPNIESIVFPPNMKNNIINIMDFFQNNEQYYINNGMRYKNIILNLGYPGTGKTTFSTALAAKYSKHIYSLNLANVSSQDDLNKLMDRFAQKVTTGIIMIDDIDHIFDVVNEVTPSDTTNDKPTKQTPKYHVNIAELLGFFDGLNTIHGLVVIMCANDPLKFFEKNKHSFSALCRDQRINHIFEFQTCDHAMVAQLYNNIFGSVPKQELVDNIEEKYYAPCTIAKVFSSFFEKNGGQVMDKQDAIDQILVDLANKKIKTNEEIITEYSKRYQRDYPNVNTTSDLSINNV